MKTCNIWSHLCEGRITPMILIGDKFDPFLCFFLSSRGGGYIYNTKHRSNINVPHILLCSTLLLNPFSFPWFSTHHQERQPPTGHKHFQVTSLLVAFIGKKWKSYIWKVTHRLVYDAENPQCFQIQMHAYCLLLIHTFTSVFNALKTGHYSTQILWVFKKVVFKKIFIDPHWSRLIDLAIKTRHQHAEKKAFHLLHS